MKRVLRSFFLIINYKTLIITVLSVVSTYFCYHFELTAKFPDMLVGVAIVFPVVFSISAAYNRRETALQRFSDFKGHAIALFYATRDWTTEKNHDLPARVREQMRELLVLIRSMFMLSNRKDWEENEKEIYSHFSKLSEYTMELRKFGVQSGEISRVSQYVSKMIIAFDNLKIIQVYRTPITLRAYSKVFIYVFPIIYGPYFASTFNDYSAHLEYVMPILYSFILVSLDNIQDHLENPFDEIGEDDVRIEEKEIVALMQ
jgi:predicted membrane chloride channel (bestrophin family)